MEAHAIDLRAEVEDEALVDQVVSDWRRAGLPPHTEAALAFAEKLTRTPSALREEDVQALRDAGLSDEDIHDVVQIVAYFNYINRVADALGVPLEPDMKPRPDDAAAR